jgi:hypothetical protein
VLGGYAWEEETEEISNGGGRGNELVNSKNPPLRPLYIFWEKDCGPRCGTKSRNDSPLTVKNWEIYSTTYATVRNGTEWHVHWCHKGYGIGRKKNGTDKCKIYREDYVWRIFRL